MKTRNLLPLIFVFCSSTVSGQSLTYNNSKLAWEQVSGSIAQAEGAQYYLVVDEGTVTESKFTLTNVTCSNPASPYTCVAPIPVIQIGKHSLILKASRETSVPSTALVIDKIESDTRCLFPTGSTFISIFPTRLTNASLRAHVSFQLASPGSPITRISIFLNDIEQKPVIEGPNVTNVGDIWFDRPTVSGTYPIKIRAVNQVGCVSVINTGFTVFVQ